MWKAVYNSIRKNLERHQQMKRLHLFEDGHLPPEIQENITNQLKQGRVVPTRLDHMDKDVAANYPKIMEYPHNYVLK